ncbi:MAG TPA: glycosyltransferase [Caulobacteraceae bacterium]|nr:glycosyltransferase [Caulobacteraceae bacterium]
MIVEIGPRPYVARALPDETRFFATDPAADVAGLTTISWAGLWRALGDPATELIVCHPNFSAPFAPRALGRALFSSRFLRGRSPLLRSFGVELLRWRARAPIAVVDHEDLPVINRDNLFLLDRCALWFKRELPVDHWRVFLKTAHPNLPTPRFRREPRNLARVEKLRPISIGLSFEAEGLLPAAPAPKTADVFFLATVDGSSTARERGLAELRELRAQGLAIDLPDAPLPRDEFYRRCAAAWLVWSPEGLGWDCFRHYEALACGAVPLINQPSIDRHAPLIAGEHALYYDPEPGGLTRAVLAALRDRPALARIAEAGRAHVLAHHTPAAIARHIVRTARGAGDEDS